MEELAAVTLGVVWLAACTAKARRFSDFSDDIGLLGLAGPRLAAAMVLVAEGTLGLLLLSSVARPILGYVSLSFMFVATCSFVIRAGRTSALACGCFGLRREPRNRSRHDTRWRSVAGDCLRPAALGARNAGLAALSAVAAEAAEYTPAVIAAVLLIMSAASDLYQNPPTPAGPRLAAPGAPCPHPTAPALPA